MHWDTTISIGNVLSAGAIIVAIFMAFYKFVRDNKDASTKLTNATNNLAGITDGLSKSVERQGVLLNEMQKTQQSDKAELLAHNRDMKEALASQIAATNRDLMVHTVEDKGNFAAGSKDVTEIRDVLTRIERKLEK